MKLAWIVFLSPQVITFDNFCMGFFKQFFFFLQCYSWREIQYFLIATTVSFPSTYFILHFSVQWRTSLKLCLGPANLYIIHKPISKMLVTPRALFFVFLNNTLQGTSLTRKYHAQSCCNKWSRDQFLSGVITLSFLRFFKTSRGFFSDLEFFWDSYFSSERIFQTHRALYAHLACREEEC